VKVTIHTGASRILHGTETLRRGLNKLAHEVMELICPSSCAVCREEIADSRQVLCEPCWGQLRENLHDSYCRLCGHNIGPYGLIDGRCHRCQNRRPAVTRVVRVGDYDGPLRDLILAFKFGGQSRLDVFLGSLLAAAIIGDDELTSADVIVPIPLHWRRRWTRKYNQSELLARSAVRELKHQGRIFPLSTDFVRVRYTQPQTSMAPSHRLINLRRAFAARPDAPFAGKHICLVDDVTTTGTTLRVAAQALKKTGAARVSAAVLAVAAND